LARERQESSMSLVTLSERFDRIERAYVAALAGREPEAVSVFDLLPAIFEAVPNTTPDGIVAALRWSARNRAADRLRQFKEQQRG
jgi:cobalamin biosynthesis protein CobD/CbiB